MPAAPQGKKLIYPNNPNPVSSALVSFFLPGVGQMMLGQSTKGIVMLAVGLFTGCFGGLLNIAAAIDAYQIGKKLEQGRPVEEWEMF